MVWRRAPRIHPTSHPTDAVHTTHTHTLTPRRHTQAPCPAPMHTFMFVCPHTTAGHAAHSPSFPPEMPAKHLTAPALCRQHPFIPTRCPSVAWPPLTPNRLFPCVFPPRLFFAAHTGGPAPPEPWPTLQAPFISLLTPFVQPPPSLPPLPQPSGPAPRAPQPPVALAPRRPSCTQLPRALPTQRLPPHHLSCPQTPIWPHFIWSHPLCYLLFDRVDCRRRAR